MSRDRRAGKTYYLDWHDWELFCWEKDLDPYSQESYNFDLGGGNYFTVALKGEKDEL